MKTIQDDVISYREMCDSERVQTLQRGMNFRLNPNYSVILMSQRLNAPYQDRIDEDGITIEYEGHDASRTSHNHDPKTDDQPYKSMNGRLTQNGLFIEAIQNLKTARQNPNLSKCTKNYSTVFGH